MAGEVVYAKIMGSGEFPLDMLRYDSCSPATEEDSGIIRSTFDWHRSNLTDGNWVVLVKKVLREKRRKNDNVFTAGRWNSFGCSIQEVENQFERGIAPDVRISSGNAHMFSHTL